MIIFLAPTGDLRSSPAISRSAILKICSREGAVDCRYALGRVVGPQRIGRCLFQDREGQLGAQVAAQAALFYHQFQTLHRQGARAEKR
ncbi:hypothetical protein EBZ37_06520 [bacterium]|nr:hypothetical protein [bacterium]